MASSPQEKVEVDGGSSSKNTKLASGPGTTTDEIGSEEEVGGGVEVHLYVYDLSRGLAKSLSPFLVGQKLEGIWHTSVVVYGEEIFFGAQGIATCPPCGTVLGTPTLIHPLGRTEIPQDLITLHVAELGTTVFRGQVYDLFTHNCNHFSHQLANFLVGQGIPDYILNLSEAVKDTGIGKLIQRFSANINPASENNSYDPNPLADFIREGVLSAIPGMSSSDEGTPGPPEPTRKRRDLLSEAQEEEKRETEEKKKNREPPIVFRDICGNPDELLDELEKSLAKVELNEEEMRSLRELREYAVGDEGSWVLSDDFLGLVGRILLGGEAGVGDDAKVYCCKVLAWLAVTKDDVILVLHQDRRDHILMRYANSIDQMTPPCQEAVALLLCNLFENLSTSDWLLYISEWDNQGRGVTSNIRVTTKVGVHALLSKEFKDVGSSLIYNMVTKEVKTAVFDDVAVELAMALLQFLSEKPAEPLAWRGLRSLLRCCQLARAEVPGLIQMVGPPPANLRGISKRCDDLITSIESFNK